MAGHMRRTLGRQTTDLAVAAAAFGAYALFAAQPVEAASALGGWIGRTLGPRFGVSHRATRNLVAAFPDATRDEIATIVKNMWDSLGRTFAEAAHLDRIIRDIGEPGARVSVVGIENTAAFPDGKPAIFASGHFANWEILPKATAALGYPGSPIFRDPNNPYVSRLLKHIRHVPEIELVPKGAAGARIAFTVLSRGQRLGILADQKMNDGIAVPFFGREVMTAPALAHFALRFNCPIIPLRVERLDGVRFRLTIGAPLVVPVDGNRRARIAAIMTDVNRMLEGWIRERPAEWLWLHNRWSK